MKSKRSIPRRPKLEFYESDFDSFGEFINFSADLMIGEAVVDQLLSRPTEEVVEIFKAIGSETLLLIFYDLGGEFVERLKPYFSRRGLKVFKSDLAKMSPPSVERHAAALRAISLAVENRRKSTAS